MLDFSFFCLSGREVIYDGFWSRWFRYFPFPMFLSVSATFLVSCNMLATFCNIGKFDCKGVFRPGESISGIRAPVKFAEFELWRRQRVWWPGFLWNYTEKHSRFSRVLRDHGGVGLVSSESHIWGDHNGSGNGINRLSRFSTWTKLSPPPTLDGLRFPLHARMMPSIILNQDKCNPWSQFCSRWERYQQVDAITSPIYIIMYIEYTLTSPVVVT